MNHNRLMRRGQEYIFVFVVLPLANSQPLAIFKITNFRVYRL